MCSVSGYCEWVEYGVMVPAIASLWDRTVCLFIACLLLFYAIATVFRLYYGDAMMYEIRERKPETTSLPTQEIFNLRHHIGTGMRETSL